MKRFGAHGSMEVRAEGQLLIIHGTGPWNLESLKASTQKAKPMIGRLSQEPWGVVLVVYGEPVYVPEAAQQLVKIVQDDKSKGRIATGVVVEQCDSPRFARNHIGDIYDRAGESYAFVDTIEQAKEFVLDQITTTMLSNLASADVADGTSTSLS